MRLICPNCDAHYEVAAGAIPDEGRDVQCSACGHGWYQLPVGSVAADDVVADGHPAPWTRAAVDAARTSVPAPGQAPVLAPVQAWEAPAALATPPRAAPPVAARDDGAQDEGRVDAPPPPAIARPRQRPVDANVLSVLREEAAREVQARARDEQRLETQGDLGLDTVGAAARRPPPAPHLPDGREGAPRAAGQPARAGGMLPDIGEINSTLRPVAAPGYGPEEIAAGATRARRGFRLGFGLMLLLAVALAWLYVLAPDLAPGLARVPALAGAVEGFVSGVDAARLWLDGLVRSP